LEFAKAHPQYKPLNRFPNLEQDITLRTSVSLPYAKLEEFIQKELDKTAKEDGYRYELLPLDIFEKEDSKDHKQTTWRIILEHPERTLTTEESNKLLDKISADAKKELSAERI
jgi:phenylalanyl-tRNA synthetase beta subunit